MFWDNWDNSLGEMAPEKCVKWRISGKSSRFPTSTVCGLTIQLQLSLLLEMNFRTKHVTVKARFNQECVQRKIIMIAYIKTNKKITDIMTGPSTRPQFTQHRDYALGIIDCGGCRNSAPDPHVCLG